jgi:hypothetical protein
MKDYFMGCRDCYLRINLIPQLLMASNYTPRQPILGEKASLKFYHAEKLGNVVLRLEVP